MTKSEARKWIRALRSGKFKQGQGALCKDGKHCCLGVLCEINKEINKEAIFANIHYNGSCFILPFDLALKYSLEESGVFLKDGTYVDFAKLNDYGLHYYDPRKKHRALLTDNIHLAQDPFTFDEIADIVQAIFIEGREDFVAEGFVVGEEYEPN